MILPLFFKFCIFQQRYEINRLIQYSGASNEKNELGSTRIMIDHKIANFEEPPSSSNAVFVDIRNFQMEELKKHIDASSPIIFMVPEKAQINTSKLEEFFIEKEHKVPIYFAFGLTDIPKNYSKVKVENIDSNSKTQKQQLQNIFGKINSSSSFASERIALFTTQFDSFSIVPALKDNSITIGALLETLRMVSKYPITNDWVLIFAITDGKYCNYDGLNRLIKSITKDHPKKIEFAVSLENISPLNLVGHIGQRIRRGSNFAKFMIAFTNALDYSGINISTPLSDERRSQQIFSRNMINSVAVSGEHESEDFTSIINKELDISRANKFAWALAESILKVVYDIDDSSSIINLNEVDVSLISKSLHYPRMPFVRPKALTQNILQYMKKFTDALLDEWSSNSCYSPSKGIKGELVFYNTKKDYLTIGFAVSAVLYAALLYFGGISYLINIDC